ncbi:MAG TPA: hypothetical protein VFX61_03090 [Micromonosporaceae bacterium]|nr:hypothetical protein [Micromonosporaceae bacterium]
MAVDAGSAARELGVVLALAAAGLLLALVAAFTPWYGRPADPGRAAVVELHTPPEPVVEAGLAVAN